jgi:hypothetical protein
MEFLIVSNGLKKETELLVDTFGCGKNVSGMVIVQNFMRKDTPNDILMPCGLQ